MELEAGVMPRAADGFADEDALIERRAIVRAFRADGEPVRLDAREQNGFALTLFMADGRLPFHARSPAEARGGARRRGPRLSAAASLMPAHRF